MLVEGWTRVLHFLACILLLTSCKDVNETKKKDDDVRDLLLHSKAVVDKRWTPPICFLVHPHYGYYSGPILTAVSCESVAGSVDAIVIPKCNSCWQAAKK